MRAPVVETEAVSRALRERELDPALAGGQGQRLRLLGGHGHRDHRDHARLAVAVALHLLAHGQGADLLEDDFGGGLAARDLSMREHHVHPGLGLDEAGHADHFVHPHRDRAHPIRDEHRQAAAGADRRELGLEQGLVLLDRGDQPAADRPFSRGDDAGGHRVAGPRHQANIGGLQHATHGQLAGGDGDIAAPGVRGELRRVLPQVAQREEPGGTAGDEREGEDQPGP